MFPPIFERRADEVIKNIFSPGKLLLNSHLFIVLWNDFMDVPVLLFYPPYPLPKFSYIEDIPQNV